MFQHHRPITIRIDPNGPQGDSPETRQRLQRIAEHYQEFDTVFASIESKLPDQARPLAEPTDNTQVAPKPR